MSLANKMAPALGISPGRPDIAKAYLTISACRHLDNLPCRKAVGWVCWDINSTTCPYFIGGKSLLPQTDHHLGNANKVWTLLPIPSFWFRALRCLSSLPLVPCCVCRTCWPSRCQRCQEIRTLVWFRVTTKTARWIKLLKFGVFVICC